MLKTVALTLIAGLAAGLLWGGRISNLARLKLRWLPLLYSALVAGLFPLFIEVSAFMSRAFVFGAYAMLVAFLVRAAWESASLIRLGFIVLTTGWLLNAAAISMNGGMPLSLRSYRASGQTEDVTAGEGGFFKIVIADDSTRFSFLGDVIPIRPLRSVVSAGDILLSLGAGITVVGAMKNNCRRDVISPHDRE